MSLYEKVKELDEEAKEGTEKADTGANLAVGNDDEAAEPAEAKEPPAAKEPPPKKTADKAPPAEEEPAKEPTPAEHNAAMAKMRRDTAAAIKRADEAERQAAELRRIQSEPKKAAPVTDAEPNKDTDPEAHVRWELKQAKDQLQDLNTWRQTREKQENHERLVTQAIEEFGNEESKFRAATPDYDSVSDFAIKEITKSLRITNPGLDGAALGKATQNYILRLAGQGVNQGYNPAEYLYHTAKSWGYTPPAADPAAESSPGGKKAAAVTPKPSLKTIADNKKRSATSATPGGKTGHTPLSREGVLSKGFGLSDFSRLTAADLAELESLEQT